MVVFDENTAKYYVMRVFYIILHRKTSKRIVIQVYRKDWFAKTLD